MGANAGQEHVAITLSQTLSPLFSSHILSLHHTQHPHLLLLLHFPLVVPPPGSVHIMAQQGSSRPLRPIAPRTTPGAPVPAISSHEEGSGKVRRAPMACTECKKRRTKVLVNFIVIVLVP